MALTCQGQEERPSFLEERRKKLLDTGTRASQAPKPHDQKFFASRGACAAFFSKKELLACFARARLKADWHQRCCLRRLHGLAQVDTSRRYEPVALEVSDAHDHCAPRIKGQVFKSGSPIEHAQLVIERMGDNAEASKGLGEPD